MVLKSGKQVCAKPGCKNWAMKDGSGLCYSHNPAKQQVRHTTGVKNSQNFIVAPDRFCSVQGCKSWSMRDGSGYCYIHNPTMAEKRKAQNYAKLTGHNFNRPPEKTCTFPGCRGFAIADGSCLCFWHHPALAEKRQATITRHAMTRHTTELSAERRCSKPGCRGAAVRNDPSGLCISHQPANMENQRNRMKGNTHSLGHHQPYLGLENMAEARGLLFFSLETHQPLLTLRALTKIVSLHRLERLARSKVALLDGLPERADLGASKEKDEPPEKEE